MTVIISAHGKDFVVLAADKRGTFKFEDGGRVEVNDAVKLRELAPHVGVLVAGDSYYATNLLDIFEKRYPGLTEVREVAERLAEVCREDSAALNRFVPRPYYAPKVGFIVSGLDTSGASPTPSSFHLRGELNYQLGLTPNGRLIDGKTSIPVFVFGKAYQPDMNVDDLATLVALAISETREVDGDVGGEIQMAIIREDGFRMLPTAEVEEMIASASLRVELEAENAESDRDAGVPEATEAVEGPVAPEKAKADSHAKLP